MATYALVLALYEWSRQASCARNGAITHQAKGGEAKVLPRVERPRLDHGLGEALVGEQAQIARVEIVIG